LILPQSVIVSFLRLYHLRLSILFNEMSQTLTPARTEVTSETIHKFLDLQLVEKRDAAHQRHTVYMLRHSTPRFGMRGDALQRHVMFMKKELPRGERIRISDPVPKKIRNSKCFNWYRLGTRKLFFLSLGCKEVVPREHLKMLDDDRDCKNGQGEIPHVKQCTTMQVV